MNLQKVKHQNEIPIGEVVSAELVIVDGNQQSVVLKYKDGRIFYAGQNYYSQFACAILEKPKMVKRHKVSSKIMGSEIVAYFDSKFSADSYREKLQESSLFSDIDIAEVEVQEDSPEATKLPDDLPF